jgi:5-methyltetrahydropteroyltriglutamate--homocysteine methyltransferase
MVAVAGLSANQYHVVNTAAARGATTNKAREENMHKSQDRIHVTHAGSLPRGEPLGSMLIDQEAGKPVDAAALEKAIDARVTHVLDKQTQVGIDEINDGEQGRIGFQTYVAQRMSGFGGVSNRPYGKDWTTFPQFSERFFQRLPPRIGKVNNAPQAIADIKYRGAEHIAAETERLKRLAAPIRSSVADIFMNAAAPGIIATTMLNAYYKTYEDYLAAIAREMHKEYAAVVNAGFILQLDAPDLAMERTMLFQDKTDAEFVKILEQHIAAVNLAIEGLPADRVRLHVCWGNWEGPHVHDVPMEVILPTLYKAKVGALGLEFGNSRKQHETAAIRKHKLPANMMLIAGVIDSKSNMVEHPEVVAQRIESIVAAVGDRQQVIAGVDCGFGTFVGWEWVTEDIVWAKLKTLREGADIASQRLWGKKAA